MPSSREAEWYRAVLDEMTEMVCRYRADGTLLFVNRAYCEAFGVVAEEVVGTSYAPLIHPDDLARVNAEVARMSPERPLLEIQNRIVRTDGRVRWTRWTNRGFFDAQGRMVEAQSSGRDVTHLVAVEGELRASHDRFRFLAEASRVLASSLELEATLESVARLAVPQLADSCTVFLLAEDTLVRRTVAHVDPAVERELAGLEEGPADTQAVRALVDRVRAGEVVHATDVSDADLDAFELDPERDRAARLQTIREYMVVPMMARGESVGALSLVSSRAHSDRTWGESERELAREFGRRTGLAVDNARLFRQLESEHERKDQYLATLAHELRNPMAAVSSALEILHDPDLDDEARGRALAVAGRQLRQQSRMVDDLLDLSRLTRGRVRLRRQPMLLSDAIEEIIDGQTQRATHKSIELRLTLAEEAPLYIDADRDRLQQIIGNLVDNAIKFTSRGEAVEVHLAREGDMARVEVRDRGPGLPPEVRERMFDLFVQGPVKHEAPSSGLGIGLTIARELTLLHDGRIEARDREGGGAVMIVRLPLVDAPLADDEGSVDAPSSREALSVLVVDDNRDAADMLGALLSGWGHQVDVCHGGAEAVERARDVTHDLILLDLGMPGMDGFETARAIRALPGRASTRLVALTGYAQPSDVEACLAAGFDRHVAKPIGKSTLLELIGEVPR